MSQNHLQRPRQPRSAAPYGVLAISLLITVALCFYVADTTRHLEREHFDDLVRQSRSAIDTRLQTYLATLRAGAALFSASQHVSAEEFQRFAASLHLQEHYPGVQGIGYSRRVTPQELESFLAQVRAAGKEQFRIWPEEPRDEYHTILYLEPLDRRNHAAIGYDMYTEPTRQAAMAQARDSGRPAASGVVTLVQEIDEDKQAGFLIYVPVYEGGQTPESVEERRQRLAGFVYAPFRADDLFGGIFGTMGSGEIGFRIYDALGHTPEHLLHNTHPASTHTPRMTRTQPFNAAGRRWSIEFFSLPNMEGQSARSLVWLVAIVGTGLSLVLFGLMRSQEISRLRAERTSGELRESEAALRRSESRFRRLFDADLVGIAFCSLDGQVIDANNVCLRMTGYSREQLLEGKIRWDRATPPEHAERDQAALRQVALTGTCRPYEKELIGPDGSRVPVLIGLAALEGHEGEVVSLVIDLTERKRYEQAMTEARDAAETASRLKDEFLATVSHELRTPLNAILGWTELLRAMANPQDIRHGLETIERNARSQAQLIEDLLDVSRIISGKMRLAVQRTDVAPLIDAAIEAVRPAAQAKGLHLLRDLSPELRPVLGDPMRIQQIIWNLLSNAIKFTPRGGSVSILAASLDGQLSVIVRDTGIGISRDFLPHVFERFRQADSSSTRKHGGLGLGLAIVRHLVEAHGGTVSVESEGAGTGATFRVSLPAMNPSDNAGAAGGDAAGPQCDASLHGVRVLVVDDEPDARELLVRVLEMRGATVIATDSVATAMEQLSATPFDVLLADISMPVEDGYELIARLRRSELPHLRQLLAIAVTAQAREQDRQRALASGFSLHLPKPVQGEELCRAVADLVGEHARR